MQIGTVMEDKNNLAVQINNTTRTLRDTEKRMKKLQAEKDALMRQAEASQQAMTHQKQLMVSIY